MDGHMDSFGTQQQQQQRSSSSSGGSVRVLLLAWADSTRLPTSLQYYRKVHNPLFHNWFPCM